MELFKLFGTIAINNSDANNAIDETTGKAEKSEPKMVSVFKKIGTAVAACFAVEKITKFGKTVVDITASFEDGMLKVQSLSGATQEEYNKLSQAALEYGSTTAWTAKDVSDAMGYMALAGFDTNEILESTSGMLSLASASGEDLATVTDILTDSMTGFGDGADQASRYADVLATTQAKSNTTVGMLGEAFTYVSSLAGTYKYSLEDVSAALGTMANAGVKGSMAGTALSSIITRLGTNTSGARDAIEELGVEFYNSDGTARNLGDVIVDLCDATADMDVQQKASLASTVAGAEAQKGLLAILNQGSDAYKGLQSQLNNCTDAASNMATNMESGLGGAIRSTQSALEGIKIKLGEKISPGIVEGLQKLTAFVTGTAIPALDNFHVVGDKINDIWSNKLQPAFSNLADALRPVIDLVQSLSSKFSDYILSCNIAGNMNSLFNTAVDSLADSINTLASLITGIIEGFKNLYTWCSDNKTALEIVAVAVGTLTTAILAYNAAQAINAAGGIAEIAQLGVLAVQIGALTVAENAHTIATNIAAVATKAFGTALSFATSPVTLIIAAIGALIAIGVLLYKNWDTIKEKCIEIFGYISDWISEKIEVIKETFSNLMQHVSDIWNEIKTKTFEIFNSINDFVSGKIEEIKGFFADLLQQVSDVWDGIKNVVYIGIQLIASILDAAFKIITLPFQFIWQNCSDTIISVWNEISSFITERITDIKNVIETVFNAVKDFISEVVDEIKAIIETIVDKIKTIIETVFTAIKVIIETIFDAIKLYFTTVFNIYKNIITTALEAIKMVVTTAMNAIKNVIETVFSAIKAFFEMVLNQIKTVVESVFNEIKTVVESVVNKIKIVIETIFNEIKTTIETIINKIKTIVETVFNATKTAIETPLKAAKDTALGVFDKIKSGITEKIETARDAVKAAIDKIKSFFNFHVELPHIKLPHFGIEPAGWQIGDLLQGSIPKLGIEWYAKAMDNPMIMDKPTAFGISGSGNIMAGGEKGSEVVSGTDTLMQMISGAVASQNRGLIEILVKILEAILSMDEKMGGQMREALAGTSFQVNSREFARLVKAVN